MQKIQRAHTMINRQTAITSSIQRVGKATLFACVIAATLVGCGGGDADPAAPSAPAAPTAPVTQLTFNGGVVLTLDNASTQSLTFATTQPTTAQTTVTTSSSSSAVLPLVTRADNGQYTLRLQVVGSHQGTVNISITIGAESYKLSVAVDSVLRISDTAALGGVFGSAPRTFTLSQLLASFGERANVVSLEPASPNIVSQADPNKILGTVTKHPTTGEFTFTPRATGEAGVVSFLVSGLPKAESAQTAQAVSGAPTTGKTVTFTVNKITAPTTSLSVSTSTANVLSQDFRSTITQFTCLDAEGKNCIPTLSGANQDLFEIFGSTVVVKSTLPTGTYQLTLQSGDKTAVVVITVITQDTAPTPGPTQGGRCDGLTGEALEGCLAS